uniref:Uncharacterized protein n=1 Tax=Anguilla anguilla TaxID=7936 RepID=A0A0E9UJM5_ANGAN
MQAYHFSRFIFPELTEAYLVYSEWV